MLLLFTHARIWSWATESFVPNSWMLVDQAAGRILRVGADNDALLDDPSTADVATVDLGGRCVLPGLGDAHMHTAMLGETFHQVHLMGSSTVDELCERLGAFAKAHPRVPYITGVGWDHERMGELPTRDRLDAVVNDRPVRLMRSCWHIAAVNTAAIIAAGIDPSKPPVQVDGGVIDVDDNTGLATGVVRERAVGLFKVPTPTKEMLRQHIVDGLRECVQAGLTSVQTNDGKGAWEVYCELEAEGKLPVRVHLTTNAEDRDVDVPTKGATDMLVCDRVKLFSDGSLGAGTAAIIGGYDGLTQGANKGLSTDTAAAAADVNDRDRDNGKAAKKDEGLLIFTPERLTELVMEAKAKGFRVETHAIGDRAAEVTLDAYEEAGMSTADRPVLTHCQVLNRDLIDRMTRMGVVADVQPSFVPTDAAWVRKRLHQDRLVTSYCWKTLMSRGVVVAGGSDAPVETINPFEGMYDAIVRLERSEPHDVTLGNARVEGSCFLPDECLTFAESLRAYTINAAFAAGTDDRRGRLQRGFDADFVVVGEPGESGDVMANVHCDPATLLKVSYKEVWVAGKQQYKGHTRAASTTEPLRADAVPGRGGQSWWGSPVSPRLLRTKRPSPMQCACHSK